MIEENDAVVMSILFIIYIFKTTWVSRFKQRAVARLTVKNLPDTKEELHFNCRTEDLLNLGLRFQ